MKLLETWVTGKSTEAWSSREASRAEKTMVEDGRDGDLKKQHRHTELIDVPLCTSRGYINKFWPDSLFCAHGFKTVKTRNLRPFWNKTVVLNPQGQNITSAPNLLTSRGYVNKLCATMVFSGPHHPPLLRPCLSTNFSTLRGHLCCAD